MKEKIKLCMLLIMLLIGFCFSFSAQAVTYNLNQPSGTISVLGNSYVNNMNNTWNIDVEEARPVRINYTIDVENSFDKVKIYAVNADNITTTLVATLTGSTNGTISTAIPTGKAQVVFTSDGSASYASGYIGINLNFSTDYSTSTYTSGNSIINGNLGIGTLNPTSKLHIFNTTSLSGIGGANINVTQKQPNTTATGDGGLTVQYSLTAASANSELVNDAAIIRSNNYLTGGGIVQYQRVLKLTSGSSFGSITTNLDMIRIEPAGSAGTTTNAYGLNIVSLPGTNKWGIYDQSGSNWYTNGKVGIGTNIPSNLLDVRGQNSITSGGHDIVAFANASATAGVVSGWYANGTTVTGGWTRSINSLPYFLGTTAVPQAITILNSGFVGIGTTAPDKLFTVKGVIHAQEVQVDVTGFADYVFEKGYKLKPLSEIHSFISENGHLPEIPSADEAKKNGINVADMQVMLLKKIEELTLYAIEQQKRIEALEKTLKEK